MSKHIDVEQTQRERYLSSLFRKSIKEIFLKDFDVMFNEVHANAMLGAGTIKLIFNYNYLLWRIISDMELENLKLGDPNFNIIKYNSIDEHEVVGKTFVNAKDRRFLVTSKNKKKVFLKVEVLTRNIFGALFEELYLAFLMQELKIIKFPITNKKT